MAEGKNIPPFLISDLELYAVQKHCSTLTASLMSWVSLNAVSQFHSLGDL